MCRLKNKRLIQKTLPYQKLLAGAMQGPQHQWELLVFVIELHFEANVECYNKSQEGLRKQRHACGFGRCRIDYTHLGHTNTYKNRRAKNLARYLTQLSRPPLQNNICFHALPKDSRHVFMCLFLCPCFLSTPTLLRPPFSVPFFFFVFLIICLFLNLPRKIRNHLKTQNMF